MALTAAVVALLLAAPPLTAPSGSATPSRSIFSSVASGLNMGIRSPMLGSATKTMGEMYAHWCSTRADSLLCKRRDISLQLAKATPDDKKTLLQKLKELGSSRPLPSSGGASGGSSLSKEYSAMKLSWCATEAGRATSLCSHPTSRYANTSLGRPRSAPPTPSSSEAVTWFCEKPGKAEDPVCLRRTLLAKLRERTAASAGQSAEEKRKGKMRAGAEEDFELAAQEEKHSLLPAPAARKTYNSVVAQSKAAALCQSFSFLANSCTFPFK